MKMDLGLSELDVNAVLEASGCEKEGKVSWLNFLNEADRIVRTILHSKAWGKISVSPWVKLKTAHGKEYYLNRMTGQSEWMDTSDVTQRKRMSCLAPATHLQSPPSLSLNMKAIFHEYDVENSGELDLLEFEQVLKDVGIGLTDQDIIGWQQEFISLKQNMDHNSDNTSILSDNDGSLNNDVGCHMISWHEFEPTANEIYKLFKNHNWKKEDPWIETNDSGGHPYRYNRQTGDAEWVSTVDPRTPTGDGFEDDNGGSSKSTFIAPAPSLVSRLKHLFNKKDVEGTGVLEVSDFIQVLYELNIGLKEKDIQEIQIKTDMDDDGTVRFHEFMRDGVPLLKEFMLKYNDDIWVVLHTPSDESLHTLENEYFFNIQTGESVWGFQATNSLKMKVFGPPKPLSIIVYHLKSIFQTYDSDRSGVLKWNDFKQVLKGQSYVPCYFICFIPCYIYFYFFKYCFETL